jgi:hypothetical protein
VRATCAVGKQQCVTAAALDLRISDRETCAGLADAEMHTDSVVYGGQEEGPGEWRRVQHVC